MLVIDSFVPPEYQDMVEKQAVWNEAIGDWQLPGIAYTGNNLQKTALGQAAVEENMVSGLPGTLETEKLYLTYGTTQDGDRPPKSARPKTAGTSGGATAAGTDARPKTGVKARAADAPATPAPSYPVSARPTTAKSRYA